MSGQELEESEARGAGEVVNFKFTRQVQGRLIGLEEEKEGLWAQSAG